MSREDSHKATINRQHVDLTTMTPTQKVFFALQPIRNTSV